MFPQLTIYLVREMEAERLRQARRSRLFRRSADDNPPRGSDRR